MNDQIGIDLSFDGRNIKGYEVSHNALDFTIRAMSTIRITQNLPDGCESIDTDIDCEDMYSMGFVVAQIGFKTIEDKKYILLEIKLK